MGIFLFKSHLVYLFGILRTQGRLLEVTPSFLIIIRKFKKLKDILQVGSRRPRIMMGILLFHAHVFYIFGILRT